MVFPRLMCWPGVSLLAAWLATAGLATAGLAACAGLAGETGLGLNTSGAARADASPGEQSSSPGKAGPAAKPDPGSALTIHLISASREYQSEPSLRKLQKVLESRYKVKCTASWGHDGIKELENLEALKSAELMVIFARRMKLTKQQMQIIREHWEQGKPIVGIRTAGHAFEKDDNEFFDRKVLGGHYAGHYGGESVTVTNAEEAANHPVLQGVGSLTSSKLYKAGKLAPETLVLQVGKISKAQHPVTIVHTYRGGRTFFTSLGVPSDFENKHFRRMLTNAIFWTTHRDAETMKR